MTRASHKSGIRQPDLVSATNKRRDINSLSNNDFSQLLKEKWRNARDVVILRNHGRANLYAAVTLTVISVFAPERLTSLHVTTLSQPISQFIPFISDSKQRLIISRLIRQLQQLPIPLSHPNALETLEQLTILAPTSMWTTGDLGMSFHHTLPLDLFESQLPGSQEQMHIILHAGLFDFQNKIGKEKFSIHVSVDKMHDLLWLTDILKREGKRILFILENRIENLQQADEILADFPLPVKLILINQIKKQPVFLPTLEAKSILHQFMVIDSFKEAPLSINTEMMSIPSAILCDLDVVINSTRYRQLQEQTVINILQASFTESTHAQLQKQPSKTT